MSKTNLIATRFNDSEMALLTSIAKKHVLLKKDGSPSTGLAIKYVVREVMKGNDSAQLNELVVNIEHLAKMIEQINIAIPHLMYNTTFSLKLGEGALSEQKFLEFKDYALKMIGASCGQIQQEQYQHVFVGHDNKNMKTIPVPKETNQWK